MSFPEERERVEETIQRLVPPPRSALLHDSIYLRIRILILSTTIIQTISRTPPPTSVSVTMVLPRTTILLWIWGAGILLVRSSSSAGVASLATDCDCDTSTHCRIRIYSRVLDSENGVPPVHAELLQSLQSVRGRLMQSLMDRSGKRQESSSGLPEQIVDVDVDILPPAGAAVVSEMNGGVSSSDGDPGPGGRSTPTTPHHVDPTILHFFLAPLYLSHLLNENLPLVPGEDHYLGSTSAAGSSASSSTGRFRLRRARVFVLRKTGELLLPLFPPPDRRCDPCEALLEVGGPFDLLPDEFPDRGKLALQLLAVSHAFREPLQIVVLVGSEPIESGVGTGASSEASEEQFEEEPLFGARRFHALSDAVHRKGLHWVANVLKNEIKTRKRRPNAAAKAAFEAAAKHWMWLGAAVGVLGGVGVGLGFAMLKLGRMGEARSLLMKDDELEQRELQAINFNANGGGAMPMLMRSGGADRAGTGAEDVE